jgi:sugar fermentation stimulation protein A
MKFPAPLVRATLVRRYKRFLADVTLADGGAATVHCPNPGSMLGLADPGSEVWLSQSANPKRKLPLGWELVRAGGSLVGINTGLGNAIVAEALAEGRVAELAAYRDIAREAPMGPSSRVDFLLRGDGLPICYLEVKSVTLRRGNGPVAEFPDARTARGARHLGLLSGLARRGHRAVMLYLVQRADCREFRLAADIDPAYAQAAAAAREAGVSSLCYDCDVSSEGIRLARRIGAD